MVAGRRLLALALALGCVSLSTSVGDAASTLDARASTASVEAAASRIATALSGHRVSIDCLDAVAWRALGVRYGFDPANTWALTPMYPDQSGAAVPGRGARFSPRTCALVGAFLTRPTELGTRICRHGTTARWVMRAGEAGKPARKVKVRVALLGECDRWGAILMAVHVLTHESMHLAGVVDEAEADCLAVQSDAWVAGALGADAQFARAFAREYWISYYPSQEPRYRSPDCRDGRRLDLFAGRRGWPVPEPTTSPAPRIAVFLAAQRTGGDAA
jgi:hypothetical protein